MFGLPDKKANLIIVSTRLPEKIINKTEARQQIPTPNANPCLKFLLNVDTIAPTVVANIRARAVEIQSHKIHS